MTLLTTLMLGLSAVLLLKHTHGHRVPHVAAHYQHVPSTHRRANDRTGRGVSDGDHASADHSDARYLPRTKPGIDSSIVIALPVVATISFEHQLSSSPFASVDVVARGSAPRAPGSPRGPPSIS